MNHVQVRDGKVLYVQDWPEEILPAVRAAVNETAWLIPAWCNDLIVTWNPTVDDRAADMESNFDYRNARMRICAQFIDQTEAHRVEILRHEMLHISINPLVDYCKRTIERLLPDETNRAFRETIYDVMDTRNEGCVEDLEHCIGANQK